MTHKEHNGWWNYETWVVALWMDNEEHSQAYWRDAAQQVYRNAKADEVCNKRDRAVFDLADAIKDAHEEDRPQTKGVFGDLLTGALSEVNWREIAEHLLEEPAEATA